MAAKVLVFGAPLLGFFITAGIGISGVLKSHRIYSPLFFVASVFPSAVGLFFVLRAVRKSKSNAAFVYNQVLWGAVPGFITVFVLNTILTTTSLGAIVAINYFRNETIAANATAATNSSIATNASVAMVSLFEKNTTQAQNATRSLNATTSENSTLAANTAKAAALNASLASLNKTLGALSSALTSRSTIVVEYAFAAVGRNAIHETAKLILGLRVLGEISGGVVPTVRFIVASFCAPTVGLLGSPAIVGGIVGCVGKPFFSRLLRETVLFCFTFMTEIGTACLMGLSVSKRVMLGTNSGNGRVLALAVLIRYLSNQGIRILQDILGVKWEKDAPFSYMWFSIRVAWKLVVLAFVGFLCRRSHAHLAPARYGRVPSEAHRS